MTGIRRVLVLIGLTVAVMIGAAIPASATYADSVSVKPTISTITVTAPATVTPTGTCTSTTSSYWNGYTTVYTTSYWYNATVTWSASSTPKGVTGYRVMAHLNNGQSVVMAETTATNRTVSQTVDRGLLAYQPTVSVITLTSYGWTAESPRKTVPTC